MKKVEKKIEGLAEDVIDKLTDDEVKALATELEEGDEAEVVTELTQDDVDGTKGMDANYKTNRMSIAMKSLAGMSNDQIDFFLKSLEQVGHEADAIPAGSASHNAASIKMKGSPDSISGMHESLKASLKEDLSAVFGDNKDLSEEFKEKITTLFEAAVSYRVTAAEQVLIEQYNEAFTEEVGELTETLIGKVDEYVSYVAEEWLKENEVAVSQALTTEIADAFMTDLKALFDKHYISIPPDKVDIAESLDAKCHELEEALNKTLEDNMMLVEVVKTSARENLIAEFTNGMTLSQGEKFTQLVESIEYDGDNEAFQKKLDIVKNSHFKEGKTSKTPSTNIITEEITYSSDEKPEPDEPPKDPTMRYYVDALSRTVRH